MAGLNLLSNVQTNTGHASHQTWSMPMGEANLRLQGEGWPSSLPPTFFFLPRQLSCDQSLSIKTGSLHPKHNTDKGCDGLQSVTVAVSWERPDQLEFRDAIAPTKRLAICQQQIHNSARLVTTL